MTFLFLHIFKNAGTQFTRVLTCGLKADQYRLINMLDSDPRHYKNLTTESQQDIKVIYGHFSYGLHDEITNDYKYVTSLRDPIDRVVSTYYYLKMEKCKDHPLHDFVCNLSLKDCCDLVPATKEEILLYGMFSNHQTRMISGLAWGSFPGSSREKIILDHTDLERAKENLGGFNYIAFAETIDEDGVNIAKKNNLSIPPDTYRDEKYRMNINEDRPSIEDLDTETIEAITRCNLQDLELFKYAKQIAPEINK